jgi:hypothetical protein
LSVAAVGLPVGVAYAQLAGFSPAVRLYSTILPLLAHAIFGTSRQLVVGPDAAAATDTKYAPWYLVRSDDKKRARLNCISHLLSLIPYGKVPREKVKLPKRKTKDAYDDQVSLKRKRFVPEKN